MTAEFRLPDLGEGLPEAEIVQWLVAVGDIVTLNQPIAEVETAKAIVELPSPFAGTVRTLHAAPGEVIAVGELLISIDVPAVAGAMEGVVDDDDDEVIPPNLVGYGATPRASGRPQRRVRSLASVSASDTDVLVAAPHDVLPPAPAEVRHERPRSTPPVRALAKQLGVDLSLIEATGVTGVIGREDVERYAAQHATPAEVPASAPTTDSRRETRTPIRGVRKHTAEAMVRSAFTAPHVTCFLEIDVTETSRLLADLRADRRLEGHRIGVLAVVAKAACLALRHEPSLNSRWDAGAAEIVQHHYVNLGIAAATERGLIVPNVTDAERLTLVELADAIGELAATARTGRTPLSALTGGTFSITNFGVFGVDAGTPILNPGEAGILGVGAVRSRPWEHRGEIVLRDVMTLSLSFDHRLVDGEQGSRFLAAVGDVLREPGRAMLLG
ncbi:dihydrolipoamide acetyltransferase family protein [Microbacterium memoriense]|uniref:Dihydrolipoamide acetyltransferase component of pyruvate dehydrogenase complex n=1 Tax=Microbacterium memoriense TaxID=2978350 RepID=A0ABT2PAP1_9MICO|nr:dihydrolipoamide acetyltransferase family protein [Microbacterium memoriense]MCT9000913.1 2-oxo acid dehydrogenase subunit E2 [Microbacterium memoriense]